MDKPICALCQKQSALRICLNCGTGSPVHYCYECDYQVHNTTTSMEHIREPIAIAGQIKKQYPNYFNIQTGSSLRDSQLSFSSQRKCNINNRNY